MGTHYSPSIVRSGLVMHYDMTNTQKSWKGAPAINYIPSPNASHNGSAFVNMGYNYQNLGSTLTYVTGVDNPINSPGVLEYYTGTSGYKYFSIDSTSLPTTGTYTFSYYARLKVSGGANNTPIDNQLWRANGSDRGVTGDWNHAFTFDWVRYTTTGPAEIATVLQYFISHSGSVVGGYTIQYCGFQLEVGSYATPFVVGTRSNTQALVDLTGTNTLTATSLTYVSDNTFSFNNGADYITPSSITDSMLNAGSWTVSSWVKFTTVNKGSDNAIAGHGTTSASNGLHLGERNTQMYFGFYGNDLGGSKVLSAGTWYNITFTYDNGSKLKTIYINGVFDASGGSVGYSGTGSNFRIGRYAWGTYLYGSLPVIQFHTRALSAKEVNQNFNALRGRYGI